MKKILDLKAVTFGLKTSLGNFAQILWQKMYQAVSPEP